MVSGENEKSEEELPVAVMVESKGLLKMVIGSFAVIIWVCWFSLVLWNLRELHGELLFVGL